jgi:hypothetical protein
MPPGQSMFPIITRNDAMLLMATNRQYREEKNPRFKETLLEYLLANLVISNTLGEDWLNAAIEEAVSWIRGVRKGTPMINPISAYIVAAIEKYRNPQLAGQVINLGIDFLTLIDQPEANPSQTQVGVNTQSVLYSVILFVRGAFFSSGLAMGLNLIELDKK